MQRLEKILTGRLAPGKKFFARPCWERAGNPQQASQEAGDVLTLDDYLIDQPDRTSLHRVRGDSMDGVGIVERDLVVVEHNTPTRAGDIVLAVVGCELTVKTLASDREGWYFLEAKNPAYTPILPATSSEILGVVVGVVRRLEVIRLMPSHSVRFVV